MKQKRKRVISIILIIIVIPCLTFKAYLEIENVVYGNSITKMSKSGKNTILIENSIEHKTLKRDDYNVHYFVSGKENHDLIVFLHPAFSDHRAFEQQIDYFSENYRVVTIDLIGHGLSKTLKSKDKIDSSVKHIKEIIDIEGYEKAHIVGVSIGSLIAQYFAINNPEYIKSLTALGGYDINEENNEVEKAQRTSNLSLIFRAIFSMKSFRKKIAKITCKTDVGRALFYETTSHYERKSFMVMQGLQNIIKNRKLIRLQYPTLILTGEFDINLAKKMAKQWHDRIEKSESHIIKNAGHCANLDNPIEFNQIVNKFIERNN